jgi:hypothetical protein
MGKTFAILGLAGAVTAFSGYLTVSTADEKNNGVQDGTAGVQAAQNDGNGDNGFRNIQHRYNGRDWFGNRNHGNHEGRHRDNDRFNVQVGPRPYYLVGKLEEGPLKTTLQECSEKPLKKTDFSIGHRGAGLQFPEHTKESYEAGARMGAGILECDATLTKEGELVCRHAQCDLHTTTNILATPLAEKCRVPFSPAEFDAAGNRTKAASALCCTTDLTLAEFKSLKGKMDASNPNATTVEEFMGGDPELSNRPLCHGRHLAQPQREHSALRQPEDEIYA